MIGIGLYITESAKKWNEETCREVAKECTSRGEFLKKYFAAYDVARKNGWMDSYDWFKPSSSAKKWTEETCRAEAKKCNSRGDFKKNNKNAYQAAVKNGWIDTYEWFKEKITHNNSWNEEKCREAAKECTSRADFLKKNATAYNKAVKNGWIDDYTWLNEKQKHNYWNEETCRAAAKECTSRVDFLKKYGYAYKMSCKNGWIDNYDWFREKVKNNYWNEETCREVAKECTSRSEFGKKYAVAYGVARKNGWIDDYTWLKDERFDLYKDKIDSVYVYEFPDLNAAYVGRTLMRRLKIRDYEHIFNTERDAVAKFAKENDVPVPKVKYLELDLTLEQGAKLEGYWEKYYREHGWNMLNRTKTGSIGGLGKGKWNKEACERVAKECTSRGDFNKKYGVAYNVARNNGWLDEYTWFEKKLHDWTEETCREIAKECKTRHEFELKNKAAYHAALKNGWLDEYTWFLDGVKINADKKRIWNKETCRAAAKECTSRKDFERKNQRACQVARENGWLDEYDWFEKPHDKWNEKTCREAAKKCTSRGEFGKKYGVAYNVARKKGWLESYDWFKEKKKRDYWNEETCRAAAKECVNRADFKKKNGSAYVVARKNGWLDDLFPPKHLKECLISDIKPLSAYLQYQRI